MRCVAHRILETETQICNGVQHKKNSFFSSFLFHLIHSSPFSCNEKMTVYKTGQWFWSRFVFFFVNLLTLHECVLFDWSVDWHHEAKFSATGTCSSARNLY